MPRIRRDLVTSLLLMAAFTALAGCPSSPTARQGFVTDHQGRALFLRGFNMDDSTTYGPVTPGALSRADFQLLAAHGFDFVRMVLFWNGLEHERGVYSEDYLSRISQMLDWAEEAHLWVMLDFHQDQYNTQFTGRGFPDWTVRDDGEPFFPWPWPFQSLTPAVRRCYDHFWNDEDLQQAYEDAFMVVVSRFQDRANVIGYDLMNEPFNGDLPLPDFEKQRLPEFVNRLGAAIRSTGDDNWIFYEPVSFTTNMGLLPNEPWPRLPLEKLAYAPHLYQLGFDDLPDWDGDTSVIDTWENNRTAEAAQQRAPMLLGEWGVPWAKPGIEGWVTALDRMVMRSGSGLSIWLYGRDSGLPFDATGTPRLNLLPVIHAYPRAVAGDPTEIDYDAATRIFTLVFREKPGVSGPTEIYVPERFRYPEGWNLRVSDPAGSWTSSFDSDREVLTLTTDPTRSDHTVVIEPAQPVTRLAPDSGLRRVQRAGGFAEVLPVGSRPEGLGHDGPSHLSSTPLERMRAHQRVPSASQSPVLR